MPHWSERVFFLDFPMTRPWLSCFLLRATWTPLHLQGAPEKEGLPAFTCSTGWPYIRLWKWALQWKNPGVHGALSPATLCSTRGDSPVDSKSREILEISAVKLQWGWDEYFRTVLFFSPKIHKRHKFAKFSQIYTRRTKGSPCHKGEQSRSTTPYGCENKKLQWFFNMDKPVFSFSILKDRNPFWLR